MQYKRSHTTEASGNLIERENFSDSNVDRNKAHMRDVVHLLLSSLQPKLPGADNLEDILLQQPDYSDEPSLAKRNLDENNEEDVFAGRRSSSSPQISVDHQPSASIPLKQIHQNSQQQNLYPYY